MASERSPLESENMSIPFPDEEALQKILQANEGMRRTDAEAVLKVQKSFAKDKENLKKRRPDDPKLVEDEMLK